jgi:hypothetical protein
MIDEVSEMNNKLIFIINTLADIPKMHEMALGALNKEPGALQAFWSLIEEANRIGTFYKTVK